MKGKDVGPLFPVNSTICTSLTDPISSCSYSGSFLLLLLLLACSGLPLSSHTAAGYIAYAFDWLFPLAAAGILTQLISTTAASLLLYTRTATTDPTSYTQTTALRPIAYSLLLAAATAAAAPSLSPPSRRANHLPRYTSGTPASPPSRLLTPREQLIPWPQAVKRALEHLFGSRACQLIARRGRPQQPPLQSITRPRQPLQYGFPRSSAAAAHPWCWPPAES
jgi:hypothetical protein